MTKTSTTYHARRCARHQASNPTTPAPSDHLAAQHARQGRSFARYWLLVVMLLLAVAPAQAQWTNNQAAVNVIGQPDLASNTANNGGLSANTQNFPPGVAADPATGKVYVADGGNNRVLRYSSAAAMLDGQAAEAVLGQPNFTSSAFAFTASGMSGPNSVFVDGAGRLWVADTFISRVLRFDNAAAKADGAPADGVLGQPNFTSSAPSITPSGMNLPRGIFVDGAGRLWVADGGNNRVLRFDNAAAKANGANADGVLGQPDFVTAVAAATQNGAAGPSGVFVNGAGRLWVADFNNNRVLRYDNAAAKADGANADGVLGQLDFTSNAPATTLTGMRNPFGVFCDPSGRLYVSDRNNHRVLIFNSTVAQLGIGGNADNVLGQPDFTSGALNNGGISATSLNGPRHLFFDPATSALFVADQGNHRIKRYTIPLPVWANNQPAVNVIGQPGFSSNAANNGGRSATTLNSPSGVAADPATGKVFVADTGNNRVLRYSSMAVMLNGQAAEGVLGQANFTSNAAATTQNGLRAPLGVFVDGAGRLWVADTLNNRVLRFDNAATKANGSPTDGVLGQPNVTTLLPAISQSRMFGPSGVAVDAAGRLWVADSGGSRVLRFDNAAAKANGANADGVLGQSNFTAFLPATGQSRMALPRAVFVDDAGRLWVADQANNRVLRFDNAAAKSNGANADGVLGQPNFTSNNLTLTQSGMAGAFGVFGDPTGRLYVADALVSRVLIFDNAATLANGAPADNVLGQANFTGFLPNQGGLSATSVFNPGHLFFDPATSSLYVADRFNHRVKRYALQ